MEKKTDISVCYALQEKFCSQDDLEGLDNIIILKNSASQLSCDQKKIVGLDHCNIRNAGRYGDIKEMCPLIEELDLSSNLLTDWNEVLNISEQLEHLRFLNLSHNSFNKLPSLSNKFSTYQDPTLKKLILNNTGIDLPTLTKLLHCFPSINELHLSVNGISTIPENITTKFNSLKTLHFAKNEVTNWSEIEKLGRIFPSLTVLNVCENPITKIPKATNAGVCFPCLQKLNIMETDIIDVDSVDNLQKFPNLSEVRIKGCPVYARLSTEKENRYMMIARLPKLKWLNGSQVEFEEREDAERMFIRCYMKENEKPAQYFDLVNIYGELEDLAEVNMNKGNFCNVLITGDVDAAFLMQVDLRKTVKELRKELSVRLDLKLKKMRLIHFEQEENILAVFGGIPMDEAYKKLTQYYVEEGNSIQVINLELHK